MEKWRSWGGVIILTGIIGLTGCSSPEVITKTKEVLIPVDSKYELPLRDLPYLPVQNLKDSDTPRDIIIKYDRSIRILMDEVEWYRSVINNYNKT